MQFGMATLNNTPQVYTVDNELKGLGKKTGLLKTASFQWKIAWWIR